MAAGEVAHEAHVLPLDSGPLRGGLLQQDRQLEAEIFLQEMRNRRVLRPLSMGQATHGALAVDAEVVDHRIHGEGKSMLVLLLQAQENIRKNRFDLVPQVGTDNQPHAPAGHAAQHPESPE